MAIFCWSAQALTADPIWLIFDPQTLFGQLAQVGACGWPALIDGAMPLSEKHSGGVGVFGS